MNYNNTLYYGVSKTQIRTYSQIQSVSSIANNALNIANSANTNANSRLKGAIVSYVGTGTIGIDNACSITASFPINAAIWLNHKKDIYQATRLFVVTDSLNTSYTRGLGFYATSTDDNFYAKRSSDKKTISWYSDAAWQGNMNDQGTTYYFLLIGWGS